MATSDGKAAGTVQFVTGEVKAVAVDGTSRLLQVGDRVFMKEVIATTANAVVQIHLESGRLFDLGHDSTIVLDELVVGSGTAAPSAPASPGVEDLPDSSAPGADPARVTVAPAATPEAMSESGTEHRGGDNAAVVLEQANTSAPVTSGFTADSVSNESATAEAGKNPLREEASFLVQEGLLFRHPAVAVSGPRTADKEAASSAAEGRGDFGDAQKTAAAIDLPAHGATYSDARAVGDKLALGDLLQGDQNASDLTAYLSFTYDAHTHSTTVNVHPASGGGEDQKIVLMGVDLTAGGTLTTDSLIQHLLAQTPHSNG